MGVRVLVVLAALAALIIGLSLPTRDGDGNAQAQSQIPTVDIS
jgi:hypothetical protein